MTSLPKLAIIGLDCAPPELVFDQLADHMPFLSSLRERGVYGPMRSTDPPITVPAWSAMLTSQDPGQLGFYGFRNQSSHDYGSLSIATSLSVKEPRLWDYLNQAGFKSIILNVPQTYPPSPINGLMVSGFLAPDTNSQFTFPRGLRLRLDEFSQGEYIIDVRNFRTHQKDKLAHEINLMTKRRFNLARALLGQEEWDFFMMVEMGPDRLHHGFWHFFDPKHRLYEPGNAYEKVIPDYYALLDREITSLVAAMPDDTLVMIVSDHGIQPMEGGFLINEWLNQKGWLRLKTPLPKPGHLKPEMVDWQNTLAWAEGGYYSRIFLNIQGREPQGALPENQKQAFCQKLCRELEALKGPDQKPLKNRVLIPSEIYTELKGLPPDLILYPGNLAWRALATVGCGEIFSFENDTGPDDANHAPWGIFMAGLKKGDLKSQKPLPKNFSLYDMAPTVLNWLGQKIPSKMTGHPVFLEKSH
jgi:predicted AlkP superfamily phosphohydrolase/phosphomutase